MVECGSYGRVEASKGQGNHINPALILLRCGCPNFTASCEDWKTYDYYLLPQMIFVLKLSLSELGNSFEVKEEPVNVCLLAILQIISMKAL